MLVFLQSVHHAKSEDAACSDYETKWRGSNKLFAFTILYLLWRYDDVIVDSGEKAWVYLPVSRCRFYSSSVCYMFHKALPVHLFFNIYISTASP